MERIDDAGTDPGKCKRCGGLMRVGRALDQTYTGVADFIGGEVCTVSAGGPGRLVACLKCEACGHSEGL